MATRSGDAPFHIQTIVVAGNTQLTATAISYLSSPALILSTGNSVSGIRLPSGSKGKVYCIKNLGVTGLQVLLIYPEVGSQVNIQGNNLPYSLAPQTSAWFFSDGAHTWHTEV